MRAWCKSPRHAGPHRRISRGPHDREQLSSGDRLLGQSVPAVTTERDSQRPWRSQHDEMVLLDLKERDSPELGKKPGWPDQGRPHLEKPQRDQAGSEESVWVWDIPSAPARLNACSNTLHPSLAWEAIALQLQAAKLIAFLPYISCSDTCPKPD